MSLLWKKPKSGRLSIFMSEFQQSPKRDGFLVVETGFPTSLIDLFVKNHDRLKKYSSKTKRIQSQIQNARNASLPIYDWSKAEVRERTRSVKSAESNTYALGRTSKARKMLADLVKEKQDSEKGYQWNVSGSSSAYAKITE